MKVRAIRRLVLTPLCLGFTAGVFGLNAAAADQEFRVENKVFFEGEKDSRVRSTTIFYEGIVYDFLENPAEVTVFDKARGRFVLLDLDRRIKAELTTKQVHEFAERLKLWTQKQKDPFLKFLGAPHFEEDSDEETGERVFASPWVTYRLLAVSADNKEISHQYREFSDWYCRLNTILNPGARPPFPRLLINAALEEQGLIPRQVHVTLRPKEGLLAKRTTARSEHLLVRQLVESDLKRVAQTGQFMAMYTSVDFREYQQRVGN